MGLNVRRNITYCYALKFVVIVCMAAACVLTGLDAMAIQLSGTVTDGKDPVPGVRVREHGNPNFVVTGR